MQDSKKESQSSALSRVLSYLGKEKFEEVEAEALNNLVKPEKLTSSPQRMLSGAIPEKQQEAEELRIHMQTPPATPPAEFYKNKDKASSPGVSEECFMAIEESDFDDFQTTSSQPAEKQQQFLQNQTARQKLQDQQQQVINLGQQQQQEQQKQQQQMDYQQQSSFLQPWRSGDLGAQQQNLKAGSSDFQKTFWPELTLDSPQQTMERMDSNASPATPSSRCSMASATTQDPSTQFWVGSGFMMSNGEETNKMNRVNSLSDISEGLKTAPLQTLDTYGSLDANNSLEKTQSAKEPILRGQKAGIGFSFPVSPVQQDLQAENPKRTFSSWNSVKSALSETPSEDVANSEDGFSAIGGGGQDNTGEFEFSSPDVSPFMPTKKPSNQGFNLAYRMKSEPVLPTPGFQFDNSPNFKDDNPLLTLCDPVITDANVSASLNFKQLDIDKSCGAQVEEDAPNTLTQHIDAIETASRVSSDHQLEYDPDFINEKYEVFNLRIIHPKGRTGFEEHKEQLFGKGDLVAGQYEVRDMVGSAAFSSAFYAYDIKNKRDVCLKIIKNKKDYFDQSLDEIKLLNYVNNADPDDHMNLLRLHDYFYYREHLFLVCELLYQNLYEWQKYVRDHHLPNYFTLSRVQSIARQVLVALKFLHSLNLIHADLKPENILIKDYEKCQVKVIDLGSSCFMSDTPSCYIQSRSYRSPEVILGGSYDGRIDIWSLGCILAELLTGGILFHNETVPMLLSRITAVFGPFPQSLLSKAKYRDKFITGSGTIFEQYPNGGYKTHKPKRTSLRARVPQADEDCLKFLSYLLTVDPNQRPTAEQALDHFWLKKNYTIKTYDMEEAKMLRSFDIDTRSPGFEFAQSNAQITSSQKLPDLVTSESSVIPME
eukprot:TRINITY_DN5676_c0_g1_i6.p1 TRINITY_DN5676_c0_g1~~TRINITY_DN5676_c0_g1_i6.p1  ORF type:complete len:879 (+),score=127.31 TRINITY_DN5676_c0_g1_i6:201-2837(+)